MTDFQYWSPTSERANTHEHEGLTIKDEVESGKGALLFLKIAVHILQRVKDIGLQAVSLGGWTELVAT